MRRNLIPLVIIVLLLAACGGNATPTAVPQIPTTADTATPEPVVTTAPREYETGAPATLPIPGTLATAPATEDPDKGTVFDDLTFSRTGGLAGQPINIELTGTGSLTRNGAASQVTPDQITQIVNAIDKVDFFGLSGVFTAPGTSADAYHYSLTITRNGASRTINAQDGLIPPELAQLFGMVSALGE
jgi:hypothetical protein